MFHALRKLFGGSRIRKQCRDITLAEWDECPAWEFCLDEEGVEGQDESTMRPRKDLKKVRYPAFDGMVACDFVASSGQKYLGLVQPIDSLDDGWSSDAELIVPNPSPVRTGNNKLDLWNQLFCDNGDSVRFYVPAMSDEECRPYIDLVYRILGTNANTFWPLTITPRVHIENYPASWTIDGWLRWRDVGNKRHVIR